MAENQVHNFLCDEVYPILPLDKVFPNLFPKDEIAAWRMECPKCHKRTAIVFKGNFRVECPSEVGCGFKRSLIDLKAGRRPVTKSYYLALAQHFANFVGKKIPPKQKIKKKRNTAVIAAGIAPGGTESLEAFLKRRGRIKVGRPGQPLKNPLS